jgi:hypothetical protein
LPAIRGIGLWSKVLALADVHIQPSQTKSTQASQQISEICEISVHLWLLFVESLRALWLIFCPFFS